VLLVGMPEEYEVGEVRSKIARGRARL